MTDKNKKSTYFEMPQLAVAPMMDWTDGSKFLYYSEGFAMVYHGML
jgi:tRNA-dihydrouridine synthase